MAFHPQHVVPVGQRGFGDERPAPLVQEELAGIADQDRDRPEIVLDRGEQRLDRGLVGHVHRVAGMARPGRPAALRRADSASIIRGGDGQAGLREDAADFLPDAAAPSRHERDAVHGRFLLGSC